LADSAILSALTLLCTTDASTRKGRLLRIIEIVLVLVVKLYKYDGINYKQLKANSV
jgi:hypothetical protein